MATTKPVRKPHEPEKVSISDRLAHPMAHYQVLLGATGLLLSLGVVMVASASSVYSYQMNNGNSWALATRQLIFAVLGVMSMIWFSQRRVETIRRIAPFFMVGVLILLVAVLFIGTATHGQKNWIEFGGPIRIQPSEFAKLAIVLWAAEILDRKYHVIDERRNLLVPLAPVCGIVLLLVIAEGDLGTAMVMMPIMASFLWFVGAPKQWFAWMAGVAFTGIIALSIAAPYR
ncbi:MAG: FtsW/RodA/SpoVE family cell cycle protein, partial [Actinomycetes bacterium]